MALVVIVSSRPARRLRLSSVLPSHNAGEKVENQPWKTNVRGRGGGGKEGRCLFLNCARHADTPTRYLNFELNAGPDALVDNATLYASNWSLWPVSPS